MFDSLADFFSRARIMGDQDANSDLTFANVRRMSESQFNKLSKNQLKSILKDAFAEADRSQATSSVDAASLKNLITEAVSDIRRELLLESERMVSEVTDRFERRIDDLSNRISLLEASRADAINELEQRNSRRKNVVLFGLPEGHPSAPNDHNMDRQSFSDILSTLNIRDEIAVERCFRLGTKGSRHRPLKVILKSQESRELLLKCASRLGRLAEQHKFRKVFIKPDLTPMQLTEEKALRAQLQSRLDAGEDVIMRRGKIINRSDS